jgi:hypothetical protein
LGRLMTGGLHAPDKEAQTKSLIGLMMSARSLL